VNNSLPVNYYPAGKKKSGAAYPRKAAAGRGKSSNIKNDNQVYCWENCIRSGGELFYNTLPNWGIKQENSIGFYCAWGY
jgi:hypothetical protein